MGLSKQIQRTTYNGHLRSWGPLNMNPESECDLTRGANRPRTGLHHEFLVENILHAKKQIEVFVNLTRSIEIDRGIPTQTPGGRIHIVIVLGARVVILR